MFELSGIFETLTLETIAGCFVTLGLFVSASANVIQKIKNKDYKGAAEDAGNALAELSQKFAAFKALMTPTVQQTPEQTAVAIENKETFAMDERDYRRMCEELTASGAMYNEQVLRQMVKQKEEQGVVEYAIMVEDHDQNPATQCKHVFVTYGVPLVLPQNEVLERAAERYATICCISN